MRLFVKKRRAMQENGVRFFRFPHSSELYLSFIGILFSHCDHDLYVRVLLSDNHDHLNHFVYII